MDVGTQLLQEIDESLAYFELPDIFDHDTMEADEAFDDVAMDTEKDHGQHHGPNKCDNKKLGACARDYLKELGFASPPRNVTEYLEGLAKVYAQGKRGFIQVSR